jgi:hypothetical protein
MYKDNIKTRAKSQRQRIKKGDIQICEDGAGLYIKVHDRVLAVMGWKPGGYVDVSAKTGRLTFSKPTVN